MILHRRKASRFFCGRDAVLFTPTWSLVPWYWIQSVNTTQRKMSTWDAAAQKLVFFSLFLFFSCFHILIRGMFISTWHFNFRCFSNSTLWMGILSVHVYAPVREHDRVTIARVIRQKYCTHLSNAPPVTPSSALTFDNKATLLRKWFMANYITQDKGLLYRRALYSSSWITRFSVFYSADIFFFIAFVNS